MNIHVQYIILYIIWKYNEENINDIIIVSQYLSEKMIVIQYFFVPQRQHSVLNFEQNTVEYTFFSLPFG